MFGKYHDQGVFTILECISSGQVQFKAPMCRLVENLTGYQSIYLLLSVFIYSYDILKISWDTIFVQEVYIQWLPKLSDHLVKKIVFFISKRRKLLEIRNFYCVVAHCL